MRTKFDNVLILGIGGGGLKIIQDLARRHPADWIKLAALDSDIADLSYSEGILQIPLGDEWTSGHGCGGDTSIGEIITSSVTQDVRELMEDAQLTIFVGCLGGGTGSGGIQILHRLMKEEGSLGFSFTTMPLELEGSERATAAKKALQELRDMDALTVSVSNDLVFWQLPADTSITAALNHVNQLLGDAILGLAAMVRSRDGIPLDLEVVRKLLREKPASCSFGTAYADGENRSLAVVDEALSSPLLGNSLQKANVVLCTLSGGPNMTLEEMRDCISYLRSKLPASVRSLVAASPISELQDGQLALTVLAIEYERRSDQVSADDLEAFALGDNTMKLTPGGSQLPVSTRDMSGVLGIFGGCSQTIHNGENLDIPTFMRKGVTIQGIVEEIYEKTAE